MTKIDEIRNEVKKALIDSGFSKKRAHYYFDKGNEQLKVDFSKRNFKLFVISYHDGEYGKRKVETKIKSTPLGKIRKPVYNTIFKYMQKMKNI